MEKLRILRWECLLGDPGVILCYPVIRCNHRASYKREAGDKRQKGTDDKNRDCGHMISSGGR